MWISNKISQANKFKRDKAVSADVTVSDSGDVIVQSSDEYRDIPIVAPSGISYMPVQGEKTVVIPVGETNVCIGSIMEKNLLNPGERKISSSGGATILLKSNGEIELSSFGGANISLKNNGTVVINGTTIPAQGG